MARITRIKYLHDVRKRWIGFISTWLRQNGFKLFSPASVAFRGLTLFFDFAPDFGLMSQYLAVKVGVFLFEMFDKMLLCDVQCAYFIKLIAVRGIFK